MKKPIATAMEEDIIKEIKIYCAESGQKLNQMLENATQLYLSIAKNKQWLEIMDNMPKSEYGMRINTAIQRI